MSVDVRSVGEERREGAVVEDIRFAAGRIEVEAYLVRPSDERPATDEAPATGVGAGTGAAGILWWHWLDTEEPDGNRTEFLDEAVAWAARGVASILPQGTYPWRVQPSGAAADAAEVRAEVARFRLALDVLGDRVGVADDRMAAVGHDFGAMIAMIALAEDPRPRGLVSVAATPRWGDWMLAFWPIPDDRIDYLRALRPLDPIEVIGAIAPRPVLLQHGDRDFYIPRMAGFGFRRAAGENADLRFYDTQHDVRSEAAREDRTRFLEALLAEGAAG